MGCGSDDSRGKLALLTHRSPSLYVELILQATGTVVPLYGGNHQSHGRWFDVQEGGCSRAEVARGVVCA